MHDNYGITVLGIDGGLANMGWAVVRLDPVGETVLAMGVIRTEKSDRKRKVLASDDTDRRAAEIANQLVQLRNEYLFRAVCSESMSFPRSSSVAAKLGVARGVVAAFAAAYRLPMVAESPQGIKKAVAGQKNASKEQVGGALWGRYGTRTLCALLDGVPESHQEHPYDALAAIVACLSSDVLVTLRGEAQARQAVTSREQDAYPSVSVAASQDIRRAAVFSRGALAGLTFASGDPDFVHPVTSVDRDELARQYPQNIGECQSPPARRIGSPALEAAKAMRGDS